MTDLDLGMPTFDRIARQDLHDLLTPAGLIALTLELPGVEAIKIQSHPPYAAVIFRADDAQMRFLLERHEVTDVCRLISWWATADGQLSDETVYPLETRGDMEAFFECVACWADDDLLAEAEI